MSCQLICLFHSEGIADIKRKPGAAQLREKEDGMGGKSTEGEGGMSLQAPGTVNE